MDTSTNRKHECLLSATCITRGDDPSSHVVLLSTTEMNRCRCNKLRRHLLMTCKSGISLSVCRREPRNSGLTRLLSQSEAHLQRGRLESQEFPEECSLRTSQEVFGDLLRALVLVYHCKADGNPNHHPGPFTKQAERIRRRRVKTEYDTDVGLWSSTDVGGSESRILQISDLPFPRFMHRLCLRHPARQSCTRAPCTHVYSLMSLHTFCRCTFISLAWSPGHNSHRSH